MARPKKIARVRVTIRGTRPLLQHSFNEHSIPLEKGEKFGVAGNDPSEWKRSMQVTADGTLYLKSTNIYGCLRDAAKHTKKGKGSIQPLLAATLQIEEAVILLNRRLPSAGDPPRDPLAPVYVDVAGVRNPSTRARNVRYRLAAAPGWEATFTLLFDKTIVSREQMRYVLDDAAILVGLGDGRSVGNGRFEVLSYEEEDDAEESPAAGNMGTPAADRLGERREKVRPLLNGTSA